MSRRRRRDPVRLLAALAAALLVFAVGVAVGMALHDNPRPGAPVTSIRTINP